MTNKKWWIITNYIQKWKPIFALNVQDNFFGTDPLLIRFSIKALAFFFHKEVNNSKNNRCGNSRRWMSLEERSIWVKQWKLFWRRKGREILSRSLRKVRPSIRTGLSERERKTEGFDESQIQVESTRASNGHPTYSNWPLLKSLSTCFQHPNGMK